jgi:preprotein translocase subunit SecA
VTRILCTAEIQFAQQEPMDLPQLPDFLTNLDDLGGQFGVSPAPAGSPFSAEALMASGFGSGFSAGSLSAGEGAPQGDPYAHLGLNRNAPCPCGSGHKYKHCHGAVV